MWPSSSSLVPPRVSAIVYGFVDTSNVFANTGAFIVKSPTTGNVFPICSGTLVSPTVFLTASHCTFFFEAELGPLGYTAFVSFDNPIPFGDLTTPATRLAPVIQSRDEPGIQPVAERPGRHCRADNRFP